MAQPVTEASGYKNFTDADSVLTITGKKSVTGIFVASSTAGTLQVSDGSTTVVNTFSASAGTFYPMPFQATTSLVITIGGTLDGTIFFS